MQVEALSAVVFTSPQPERLAEFYRLQLGIAFAHESHGPMHDHLEASLDGVHLAILKGAAPADRGGVAPTFRVAQLDPFVTTLRAAGVATLRKVIDLGEGKRLASFRDPDGNVFSLIELGDAAA